MENWKRKALTFYVATFLKKNSHIMLKLALVLNLALEILIETQNGIRVFGIPPYASDTLLLKKVVNKLNEVIEPISIGLTKDDDYNVEIHFVSLFDAHKVFGTEESHFGSSAQFRAPSFLGSIQHAQIIIYHESIERTRSKVIWEETIQILGLMQDSHKYPMSVFGYNDSKLNNNWYFKEPLPIDFQLLRILYNYDLPVNIKKSDFVSQIEKCR